MQTQSQDVAGILHHDNSATSCVTVPALSKLVEACLPIFNMHEGACELVRIVQVGCCCLGGESRVRKTPALHIINPGGAASVAADSIKLK